MSPATTRRPRPNRGGSKVGSSKVRSLVAIHRAAAADKLTHRQVIDRRSLGPRNRHDANCEGPAAPGFSPPVGREDGDVGGKSLLGHDEHGPDLSWCGSKRYRPLLDERHT